MFKVSKVGTIAGCMVRSGIIQRTGKVRVIRDGTTVYTGGLSSLKRFKDDVREVREGLECGIGVENYNDLKVGDRIEAFRMEEIKRTLRPPVGRRAAGRGGCTCWCAVGAPSRGLPLAQGKAGAAQAADGGAPAHVQCLGGRDRSPGSVAAGGNRLCRRWQRPADRGGDTARRG